ncbi:hypothetical protein N431DRAFT_501182 [Stipitochalara longipes BDJ]|nr:hypothetical protein N431DRAFT_501182 [Stipitochalara longipes BDJ]
MIFGSWLPLACLAFTALCSSRLFNNDKGYWRGKPNEATLKSRAEVPNIKKPLLKTSDSSILRQSVMSLPDVPFNMDGMYAGLIPIDLKNTSQALYFKKGQFAPKLNLYSWVNLTNMLWVEQPVGTGFSIGEITATNEEEIAQDFVNFFQNFEINITRGVTVALPFVIENQAIFGLNDNFIMQLSALNESTYPLPPDVLGFGGFIEYTTPGLPIYFDRSDHSRLGFQDQSIRPIIITGPDLEGLMWAQSFQSGHMQPEYQPRLSYRHIQWVLERIDTL